MQPSPIDSPSMDPSTQAPSVLAALGPFTKTQAVAAGVSVAQLRRLIERGLVRALLHGVYISGPEPEDVFVRAHGISRILPPGGVVARRTAAWLFGIDTRSLGERDQPIPIECVVPRGLTPIRRRGLRCYAAELEDIDVTDFLGLPCTTPVRTAADLLRWMPVPLGLTAADRFAAAGLISPATVAATLDRWPGHRFIDQARRHASWIEPLTESPGETWLRLRMLDAGFPRPAAQIPVLDDGGREVYRLDLGWKNRRIGLEYDGEDFHSGREDRHHDDERRARLEREFGWTVIGVGRGEVLGRKLDLERGVGELLGLEPQIYRRTW